MPNTLKGWKERAQKAEAEVVRLRDLAEGLMKDALAFRLTDGRADQYDRQADAALAVVKAAEASTDLARKAAAFDRQSSDFAEAKARVELASWDLHAAVDEWRSHAA